MVRTLLLGLLAFLFLCGLCVSCHAPEIVEGRARTALRAEGLDPAVRATYLISKGLAADRFEAEGYGETLPVADNTTEEGKRRNRRTEFRALSEEGE